MNQLDVWAQGAQAGGAGGAAHELRGAAGGGGRGDQGGSARLARGGLRAIDGMLCNWREHSRPGGGARRPAQPLRVAVAALRLLCVLARGTAGSLQRLALTGCSASSTARGQRVQRQMEGWRCAPAANGCLRQMAA